MSSSLTINSSVWKKCAVPTKDNRIIPIFTDFFQNRRNRFMPKNTKCNLKNLERSLETAVPPIQVTDKVYS